eukprot:m.31130 g.31130  ORF g.31130 m.31130 type:complete len:409 (+) comp16402_c0_seq1:323-1549(+)
MAGCLLAAVSWSAAISGSKAVMGVWGKVKGAPHDLHLVQQASATLVRPLEICTELGTRHALNDVMVPVIQMCEETLSMCETLGVEQAPTNEQGWKVYLEEQTGLHGVTRAQQLKQLLPKLAVCFQALTLALTTSHSICGALVSKNIHIPWGYDKDAHRKAHRLFFWTGLKSGVFGVGTIYVTSKTHPDRLELVGGTYKAKLMVVENPGHRTHHRVEFEAIDESENEDDDDPTVIQPLTITKDTNMRRKFIQNVAGVVFDDDDDDIHTRLHAFEIIAGDRRRVMFIPHCAQGNLDDDPESTFPLSAELFEATVALAIFTATNRRADTTFRGDDLVDFNGSPQHATTPSWISWYTMRYLPPHISNNKNNENNTDGSNTTDNNNSDSNHNRNRNASTIREQIRTSQSDGAD